MTAAKNNAQKEKLLTGKFICNSQELLFARITNGHCRKKRQKKWQTYKDSNLDKVNQNHLCYRYTTGLRLSYNIARVFGKSK